MQVVYLNKEAIRDYEQDKGELQEFYETTGDDNQ